MPKLEGIDKASPQSIRKPSPEQGQEPSPPGKEEERRYPGDEPKGGKVVSFAKAPETKEIYHAPVAHDEDKGAPGGRLLHPLDPVVVDLDISNKNGLDYREPPADYHCRFADILHPQSRLTG